MRKTFVLLCLLALNLSAFSQSLSLPFFDDFSKYDNRLDTDKWMPSKGIYVNSRYSQSPISKNVASFSGVSANGSLNVNYSNYGQTDTLTSNTIDLSTYVPADSVYLSFFLQTGAFGQYSNVSTSSPRNFRVEFKTPTGWTQVFSLAISNGIKNSDFRQYVIPITGAAYFHAGFQFRFRSAGVFGTAFDNWNLDYVQLAANRRKKNRRIIDVATSNPVQSVLKRYTAMPIHQFNANNSAALADSIVTIINNLDTIISVPNWNAFVQINNNPAIVIKTGNQIIGRYPDRRRLAAQIPASIFNNLSGFQEIKSGIAVDNFETNNQTRFNDSAIYITKLQDYYAFDDGSAEALATFTPNSTLSGQVGQKFSLQQPDQVSAITFYLPKLGNTENNTVTFKIWPENPNGNPDGNGLASITFKTPPLNQLNNWFTLPVNPPVSVSGNFYIGWAVGANKPAFSIGLDRNNNAADIIRYYTSQSGAWAPQNLDGVIMLRPTMNNFITIGRTEDLAAQSFQLYPNPASDFITIGGNAEKITILNAAGKKIKEQTGHASETKIETTNMPAGFYFVQVQTKNAVQTQKLIIKH